MESASTKVYDGLTSVVVDSSGASGWLGGDDITISSTGVFSDKNVGSGKTVTLTSSASGADVGNYAFTHQTSTTADITAKPVTVSGITASNKVYDGLIVATVDVSGINELESEYWQETRERYRSVQREYFRIRMWEAGKQ